MNTMPSPNNYNYELASVFADKALEANIAEAVMAHAAVAQVRATLALVDELREARLGSGLCPSCSQVVYSTPPAS